MRALHATVAYLLLELLGPAAGDVLSREMHDGIELEKFLRIECPPRSPLHLAGLRRVSNQRGSLVAVLR